MPRVKIHVNPLAVKNNAELGTKLTTIVVRTPHPAGHDTFTHCNGVRINGPSELVYRPDAPLVNGARVWLETESEFLEIIE